MNGGMEEKQCVYFQNQLLVHGCLAFGVKQPILCCHWCSGYLNNSYADKEFLFSALVIVCNLSSSKLRNNLLCIHINAKKNIYIY